MKTAPFPSSAQAASEALVGALPAGEAGFLFDAPPGYYHRRNAAFDWAEGKILFGRRPSRTLRIEEAAVEGDPLGRLEEFLRWFESSGAAIAAGYFSYDLGGYCEPSAASKQAAGLMPLAYLAAYDEYYVMCGSSGRMVRRRRDEADVEVSGPGEIVGGMGGETRNGGAARVGQLGCDFTYRQYLAAVDAAKEFILSGDIYEVNLSQRFAARYEGDPREIYLKLRRFNPAPYSAYISMPDAAILSCSPELFLRVEGNRVVTRPIKGTARRAAMGTEDEAAAAALAVSEKDNAELAMIVDLERNDLGRVCRYGTVRVSEGKRVETFARVRLVKGGQYRNARTNRTLRVGRIVRMHANDRADITDAGPGDIVALLAVECASGDTLCGEGINYSLESIYVANPVISLSVTPASNADQERMAKALSRFMKEDPTFRVSTDPQSGETLIAGMGELHLDIYVERMRREYRANVTIGAPSVSYREAPTVEAKFNYRHKKQTGGAGQFAHVIGRLIPLPSGSETTYEFEDNVTNGRIPGEYIPAVNRGFQGAMKKGPLAGYEVVGCKMCLDDGSYHAVDSSEMAFRIAGRDAFVEAFRQARPCLMEPIMKVEVEMPREYQGAVVGDLNSRRGIIHETEARNTCAVVRAEVPLANMFGYATVVRGLSKGMATFSMEMSRYAQVPARLAEEIIIQRREKQAARK